LRRSRARGMMRRRIRDRERIALDHMSQLRIGPEALKVLEELGYVTVRELLVAALTSSGIFRPRKEWQRSEMLERVALEVVDALIEKSAADLQQLNSVQKRLAKN
jgi:hypothetical protein